MSKFITMSSAVLVFAATSTATAASINVFSDDFSNGAPGAAVSINDPDPQGNPETVADNTSVSGTILSSFGPDDRPWAGANAAGGTLGGEAGGAASWQTATTGQRGVIGPNFDFNNSAEIQSAGEFTISLDDLDPVDTASGTSGNWVVVSLFAPQTAPGGAAVSFVNTSYAADLPLAVLLRDDGELQVKSFGNNTVGNTFLTPALDDNYDLDIVITNISGFGDNGGLGFDFDYDILVDGVSQTSGSVSGADTSANLISLETTTASSTLGGFAVTTVPEPASLVLVSAFGLALLRRRN